MSQTLVVNELTHLAFLIDTQCLDQVITLSTPDHRWKIFVASPAKNCAQYSFFAKKDFLKIKEKLIYLVKHESV
jgi:hypothetical protein